MTDKIVVICTCASPEDGERLARALLEEQVAACISVIPGVRSFYFWKDKIDASPECLLLIKSSRDLFPRLEAAIRKLHSYEVPEVLALPVVAGAENYLNWLTSNLDRDAGA